MIKDCVKIDDNTIIPDDTVIPPYSRVAGFPATVIAELPECFEEVMKEEAVSQYESFIPLPIE